MSPDCEPVHICAAEGLLNVTALGISGPVTGAAGTRFFEPDGVAFLTIGLPSEPSCVAGQPLPVALSDRSAEMMRQPLRTATPGYAYPHVENPPRRRGNEAEQTATPNDSLKIGSGLDGYGDIKIVEC